MDAASVSPYNLASPSTPTTQAACRISPVGSSKRKSKPVKRIVDVTVEEPVPSSNSPVMGTAAETARPEETEETDELREQVKKEQITNLEEAVKPAAMDQAEMLRKLTELLGGQFPMPTVTTPTLFPASFPLFTNTGCTLDLSAFQSNGDTNTTATNNNLVSLLGNVAFPALAINTSTPTTLSGVIPSASQITDRLRTPTISSSSLVNSKGPVKRKLFESSSRDMMRGMGQGITKEERIDLDDLENFAQMFKKQRIKFGFTQGDVGVALGRRYGTDFSQTTISRFEALNLSFKNMCKLRPLLKEWLADAEAAIANGASLNDLLERPSGEKVVKNDSPTPLSDPNSFSGEMVKRRRKRTNLDVAQRTTLDAYFAMNPRPDHERMTEIANLLDLDRDVVRVWFCNRRQKMRRTDEPDQPEDALLTSLRAIAQGDSSSSEPQP